MTGRMVSADEARAVLTAVGVESTLNVDRFFWKRAPDQYWLSVDDEHGTRALLPDGDADPADRALADLFAVSPDLAHTVVVQAEQIAAVLAACTDVDGNEYEHEHAPIDGYPECPACFAADIRLALGVEQ